ncbi:GvpL/GvpF family gas vesicle protein [Streptomyces sp. NPDC054796]
MSVYVYGIARADHPALPDRMDGVGDPPRPVRSLREGGLAAVVSDCPPDLRPKRRDLLAHQQVLSEASASDVVLPLRFGSVSEDEDAVREVLSEHADHYRDQLSELEGRVEYNVKAAHREDAVLHQVVMEEPEIQSLSAANQAAGGGSHQDRLRLGEMVAQAIRDREVRDARNLEEALAPHAERYCPGPEGTGWLVNLSYLVGREATEDLLLAVEELQERNPHLDIQLSGPLPPYSFVTAPDDAAAPAPENAPRPAPQNAE